MLSFSAEENTETVKINSKSLQRTTEVAKIKTPKFKIITNSEILPQNIEEVKIKTPKFKIITNSEQLLSNIEKLSQNIKDEPLKNKEKNLTIKESKTMNIFQQNKYNEITELASNNGWKVIDDRYVDNNTKMTFECKNGHRRNILYSSFKLTLNCSKCRKINQKNLPMNNQQQNMYNEIVEFSSNNGWKVVSDRYVNSTEKLIFECVKGHRRTILYRSFKLTLGCKECSIVYPKTPTMNARQQKHYDELVDIAIRKKWSVVSDRYIDAFTKMDFKCPKGHIRNIVPYSFKLQQGCKIFLRNY